MFYPAPAFIIFIPIGLFLAIIAVVFGFRIVVFVLALIVQFWLPLLVIGVAIGAIAIVVNLIGAVFGAG